MVRQGKDLTLLTYGALVKRSLDAAKLKDSFVGYHPNIEDAILPQSEDVLAAVEALAAY